MCITYAISKIPVYGYSDLKYEFNKIVLIVSQPLELEFKMLAERQKTKIQAEMN